MKTNNKLKVPLVLVCVSCGVTFEHKMKGKRPDRCPKHAKAFALARSHSIIRNRDSSRVRHVRGDFGLTIEEDKAPAKVLGVDNIESLFFV